MYRLEYQPAALRDLVEIAQYISQELCSPAAAQTLAMRVIEACESLLQFPYSSPVYQPLRPLRYEYRKRIVRNYAVFYRVDEDKKLVTVARVIYARREYGRLLE